MQNLSAQSYCNQSQPLSSIQSLTQKELGSTISSKTDISKMEQKNDKNEKGQNKTVSKKQNKYDEQTPSPEKSTKQPEDRQNTLKRPAPVQQTQTQSIGKKKLEFCGGSIIFTIDNHYDISKLIGSGIYGIVASGTNNLTKETIAIKKISKLFNNFGDTKRVLRQIKVLQFLKHQNIISLKDIMSIGDPDTFNEIYLCMEYMEFDLRKLIHSQTKITQQMIKYIMYQLLAAINFMHSADILHRDLKPENILMNKTCQLKLADMNLARKETFTGNITDYVASRPYRAPQILIGSTQYNKSVDIWSIGCIFAQLFGKTIIFQGKDFIDQLKRFVAILGKPKVQYFPHIDATSIESLGKLIAEIPDKQKVDWKYLIPSMNDKAADLLDHMLAYDATTRYTAEQCLNHQYLAEYKKAPKLKCEETFDFSFDNLELNQVVLREAICNATELFCAQKMKKENNRAKQNGLDQSSEIKKKVKTNE